MSARKLADVGLQPYVGLRAFRPEERGIFFGRARESLDIGRLWRANKLTVLYGASGVGKTSLLQAGVIPLLDPARFDVWPVGRIQPDSAFTAARDGNPYTLALLSSWAPDEPPDAVAGLTILDFLSGRSERRDRYGDPVPTLAAIDQAEELFSGLPQRQKILRSFMAELADGMREHDGLRLLLSLREDYLAAVLPYEQLLGGQSRTRSRLLPFGRDAALEAIREPLKGTGLSFERGAAEELVTDLQTIKVTNALGEESTVVVDSVEPVQIQVVCSALLDSLEEGASVITKSHVRDHVDVDRFLARFCGRALSAVAQEHGIAAARIRSWLQRTFITELGTRGTAYEGLEETARMPNAVVRALEDRYILKAEHRSGTRWYELQHDRLIHPIRQADPEEQLKAAWLAREEGDWDLVKRYATQAIRVFGADELRLRAGAEHLLGDVAAEYELPEEALDRYQTAAMLFEVLQDFPAVAESLAAAGRLSLAHGRYPAAVVDLQAAIARQPGDLDAQTDLARAMWHTGQPQAAVALLNGVLKSERKGDGPVLLRVAGALAEIGDPGEAGRVADAALKASNPPLPPHLRADAQRLRAESGHADSESGRA